MLVLIVIGLAVVDGLLAGGSLRRLERVKLHWLGVALGGLGLQGISLTSSFDPAVGFVQVVVGDFWGLVVFSLLVGAAIHFRRRPETHKRLMVLAVFVVIDAALGRMGWLPGNNDPITSAEGYTAIHGYQLLLLVPPVVYDLLRFRKVHFAYLLGGGLFLAFALTTYLVWNAPAWHRLVAGWAGVG